MRPSSVVVAVVLAAISVLPSFEHVTAADCDESGSCYTNPVIATNYPDPGVLKLPDGSGFVMVATSNHAKKCEDVFPILFSKDMVNWEHVSFSWFLQ